MTLVLLVAALAACSEGPAARGDAARDAAVRDAAGADAGTDATTAPRDAAQDAGAEDVDAGSDPACADRGLTSCGVLCVDVAADAMNCGSCDVVCGARATCVDGACRRWAPLGDAVSELTASAHALGSDGTDAYVAWVGDDGAAHLHRYDAMAWTAVGGPVAPPASAWRTIDLAFEGAAPRVLWSSAPESAGALVHVSDLAAGVWSDGPRSAYDGPCHVPSALALALDGATPHIMVVGNGGCGFGVAYAAWTGESWWETPMPPAVFNPGQITISGGGGVDVAWTGARALIAMMDSGVRSVRRWEPAPAPGAWVRVGSDLDVVGPAASASADTYLLSMATDASGEPWVAFAEDDVAGRRGIYVQRFDRTLGDFTLVGGGAISDLANDADEPSIVLIGTSAYVAYVEQVGGVGHVLVSRWNGLRWERVGPPMNESLAVSAGRPYAANVGGAAAVAFREPGGAWISGRVHVRVLR